MAMIGQVLLWLGFLAAAYFANQFPGHIAWQAYAPAALVGVVGIFVLRHSRATEALDSSTVQANLGTLEGSLDEIRTKLAALRAEAQNVNVYEIHGRLDAELLLPLAAFADARESMIHAMGLENYASVMDGFARGERSVNRAWSASADGYVDEVWICLEKAARAFDSAQSSFDGARRA